MSERRRILIIDASEQDRRRLEACLSDEYDVRSAATIPEADALSGRFRPHMVIEPAGETDVRRPPDGERAAGLEGMVGVCDSMRDVFSLLRRAAATDASVIIAGECGTGKELAARVIHGLSSRRDRNFVTLNAEAFDASRLSVELLGRPNGPSGALRGALEQADGGTLLLAGLEHVPHHLQDKLLAYLRTGRFVRTGGNDLVSGNVRVLVAADRPLEPQVESGAIRPDLFYRLAVLTIVLPPLRERGDDVALLAGHIFAKCAPENGSGVVGFSRDAVTAIVSHTWPGNIAEMENRICRAAIVARGPRMTPEDLGLALTSGPVERTLREARDELAREMVVRSLRRAVGNVSKAARKIGVSRATMYDLIRKYDLDVSGFKGLSRAGVARAASTETPAGADAAQKGVA